MSDEPPPKKLRKGTHSCAECRRRKKSCVPHPTTPSTCTECFDRGTKCRQQQPVVVATRPPQATEQNLQQRVTELENALLSISRRLEITDGATQSEHNAAKVLGQLRSEVSPITPPSPAAISQESRLDNAPILSLFDNAILSRCQDESSPGTAMTDPTAPISAIGPAANSKMEEIRQKLLSLFPSQQRLEAILDAAHPWWASWQNMLPETFSVGSHSTFDEFIAATKSSNDVPKLAKALLCISISLQETPVGAGASCNASTVSALTNQYMCVIDDLILSDDELAGTMDGIECLLLRAKHDSNNGRIRRAWLTFRRGISFAQLLGCHLRSTHADQANEHTKRRQSIWNALYLGDRYLSLLLGLPYCVSESHIHPMASNEVYSQNRLQKTQLQRTADDYLFRLAKIAGHVIDRNQNPVPAKTLSATVEIENELTELAASMPDGWWSLDIREDQVASLLYSCILPQIWHHQIRALLHLPFMLKAATDRRYGYNKIAALESARHMLSVFRLSRPVQGFGSLVCKIVDFQAFTAGMILVLNFLGVSPSSSASDVKEANEDREVVSITTSILHQASLEAGGGVATQAARALEMFTKVKDPGPFGCQGSCKVAIPYFGTVVFGPGKDFAYQRRPETPTVAQIPTPEEEPLGPHNPERWPSLNDHASVFADYNYDGYPLQHPQGLDVDVNANAFANTNLDLDGDWSWFWNNTNYPTASGDVWG